MKVLVTGGAGFIGMHVTALLLEQGHEIIVLDNFSDEYDSRLKWARVDELAGLGGFELVEGDCTCATTMANLFGRWRPDRVVHLAAMSGVRQSAEQPVAFSDTNINGTLHVLEQARLHAVDHVVYASSASVYGAETTLPASTAQPAVHPITLYGVTKRTAELMAHTWSTLYGLPTTGLRFFNVYGPWGRPDAALAIFTRAMLRGEPVPLFNHGQHARDFTYVGDIAAGVVQALMHVPEAMGDASAHDAVDGSAAPWRLYNIGRGQGVQLPAFIEALEAAFGVQARLDLLPKRQGDIDESWADIQSLEAAVGWVPTTTVQAGVNAWVDWVRTHPAGALITDVRGETSRAR